MHTVKCGCFHSATEDLATAYSKEFSNESCREASKTLIMRRSHSVLRAKRIDQQKFDSKLFCIVSENINQN